MPGSQYQVTSPKLHHSIYSLTDSSDIGPEDEEANAPLRLTPLEKLTTDMCKDETTIKELIIGRRVGFYKVRGEIGCGTFSRVKMAFHALTKGRCTCCQTVQGQLALPNSKAPLTHHPSHLCYRVLFPLPVISVLHCLALLLTK